MSFWTWAQIPKGLLFPAAIWNMSCISNGHRMGAAEIVWSYQPQQRRRCLCCRPCRQSPFPMCPGEDECGLSFLLTLLVTSCYFLVCALSLGCRFFSPNLASFVRFSLSLIHNFFALSPCPSLWPCSPILTNSFLGPPHSPSHPSSYLLVSRIHYSVNHFLFNSQPVIFAFQNSTPLHCSRS